MKNLKNISLTLMLGGVLFLSACGTSKASSVNANNSTASTTENAQATKEANEEKGTLSISNGTKEMENIIAEIDEGLKSKKEDDVIKEASELDEVWEKFEDRVKDKSKELYDEAEKPLGAVKAGIKVKPLDEKALKSSIEDLETVLKKVEALDKVTDGDKKNVTISDGVSKMKDISSDVKKALDANNKEQITKEVSELDEVWDTFEDSVKEKSKDLYDKVESPLGVLKAGAKIDPIDSKTLLGALDTLNKVLDEIEKLN